MGARNTLTLSTTPRPDPGHSDWFRCGHVDAAQGESHAPTVGSQALALGEMIHGSVQEFKSQPEF